MNKFTAVIEDIKGRLRENPPSKKSIIKLSVIVVLYLLFLVWVRSFMGLLVIPFIVDVYTTKYVKWTWWKKSENPIVRTIMSWVDAIVFALVAVYFVHLYAFQNFVIPSSSLEKSLLVGDYLLVSKLSYGPRKPMTPLTMPLTQHTMPVFGCKSYLEYPQWEYERIAGFGDVERNDIVVFNYPAGDIATTNPEVIDYYALCYSIGGQILGYSMENINDATPEEQYNIYKKIYEAGDEYVTSHPGEFGEKMWRPVDRRENYVKRCVGLPGDVLEIKDKKVYANGSLVQDAQDVQHNYLVTFKRMLPEEMRRELGISNEDLSLSGGNTIIMPLTKSVKSSLEKMTTYVAAIEPVNEKTNEGIGIYPLNGNTGWTIDNYGPIWIPKRGESVKLTLENLAVYERPIVAYEGNTLEVKDGEIYINGTKSDSYTFKMNYYWMMGDNRHKSADSRCWGFVPEDHIVGKPLFIWLSLDPDRGWFDGKIRWDRLFKSVESCY